MIFRKKSRAILFSVLFAVTTANINSQSLVDTLIVSLLHDLNHELDNGNYQEALQILDSVFELGVGNVIVRAELYWARSFIHHHMGQTDLALGYVLHSIELNPEAADAHDRLAVIYFCDGQYDDALQAINRAIQIEWQELHFYSTRARILIELEAFEEVLADLSYVLAIDPNHADTLNRMALLNFNRANFVAALSYSFRAIEVNPINHEFFALRGEINFNLGNVDDAFIDFTRAIELGSQDHEVFFYRAQLHRRMGNHNKALNDLNVALQFSPGNAELHELLTAILADMGGKW